MKPGRKPKFKEDMLREVELLAGMGLNFAEMASVLEISANTWTRYLQTRPEFMEAVLRGRTKADTSVVKALYKSATERNSFFAQKFWLTNRRPQDWKEDAPLVDMSHKQILIIRPSGEQKLLNDAKQIEQKPSENE